MLKKRFAFFTRGQRVDQPDLQHAVETSPKENLAQLIEHLVLGLEGSPIIIWGWDASVAGSVATVTRGASITGYREQGELRRGMLLAGGPTSRTLNVSSYADGTYGIYVRASFRQSDHKGRKFWDQPAGAQISAITPTRVSEDWDLVLERSAPGADWLQIGTVAVAAGAFSGGVTASARRLFDSVGALVDADWGGGTDRADASNIGDSLTGLVQWCAAVMRQFQDIVGDSPPAGQSRWKRSPQAGSASTGAGPRSLTQLNAEKLGVGGGQPMSGNLVPDASSLRSLGGAAARWFGIWADTGTFTNVAISNALSAATAVLSGSVTAPSFVWPSPQSKIVFINAARGSGLVNATTPASGWAPTGSGALVNGRMINTNTGIGAPSVWLIPIDGEAIPDGATVTGLGVVGSAGAGVTSVFVAAVNLSTGAMTYLDADTPTNFTGQAWPTQMVVPLAANFVVSYNTYSYVVGVIHESGQAESSVLGVQIAFSKVGPS